MKLTLLLFLASVAWAQLPTSNVGAGGAGGAGGGSVFTGSTAVTSAFSATPTFSLADVSVKSPTRFEPGAMTANVTSVTFTNKSAGAKFSIVWLQDATGGRTITYGASASNTCAISATANMTTVQQFEIAADGTTVLGTGCSSNDPLDTPVTGPASSTTNDCAEFADTTGKVIKDAVCGGAVYEFSSGSQSATTITTSDTVAGVTSGTLTALGVGKCYSFEWSGTYVLNTHSLTWKLWYGTTPGTTGSNITVKAAVAGGDTMFITGQICNNAAVQNAQTLLAFPIYTQGSGGFGVSGAGTQDATLTTLKIGITVATDAGTSTVTQNMFRIFKQLP